eukprot:GHUV01010498.1.p1 GENE.GHUV01010498.1~~GHUV01010498.1.p1  ORF type:complete len:719 (+),score=216.73 GHUV01010498.1:179-2335(+)
MGQCLSKDSVPKAVRVAATAEAPAAPQQAAVPSEQKDPAVPEPAAAACQVVGKTDLDGAYQGSCGPLCEIERRQHLLDLNILYTEPERRFDDITKLCAMVFKVPIALVSLVDQQVQWFKAVQGLDTDNTPRNMSFCAWTLLPAYPEALVVQDAHRDARFKDNPLVVGPPYIRFYAGCPLVCSNGMRLGSLCIIDREPRTFEAESCNMLANMAEMVIREIEKEKALEEHKRQQQRNSQPDKQQHLLRAFDAFGEAIMLVDASSESWNVVFANEAWETLVGHRRNLPGTQTPFWDIFELPGNNSTGRHAEEYADAIAKQQNFELLVTYPAQNSNGANTSSTGLRYATATFRCAANTGLDQHMPLIGIPNFLPSTAEGGNGFYFVSINEVESQSSSRFTSASDISPTILSPKQQAARKPARLPSFSLIQKDEPFADIKLGPLLGKGAFGRVFRGTWNGKLVAVKVIEYSQEQMDDGCLLEGILSEQVQHPNVVRTFKHATRPSKMSADRLTEVEEDGMLGSNGLPSSHIRAAEQRLETWLVLEFCNRGCVGDGVTKGWFRKQGSRFEPDLKAILPTAREIAGALSYLHSKNILHGDLTGSNVLLTVTAEGSRGWMAKVSDFGLSRLISNEAPIIETRTYGTVTHMPPELLMDGKMSKAVDVWSFGVVLWEMYMGRAPYAGLSHSQVLHTVGSGKGLPMPTDAPAGFIELLSACLSRTPEQR